MITFINEQGQPVLIMGDEDTSPILISSTEIRPCVLCNQRPLIYKTQYKNNPHTFWSLSCDCGRGSTSMLSKEDALRRWNEQAANQQIAEQSKKHKNVFKK